jgi:hypothetical protein
VLPHWLIMFPEIVLYEVNGVGPTLTLQPA